jgi:hypothetical protein
MNNGSYEASTLVAMKLAESLNIEILIRRSEWYRCGRICIETVGNTYRHSEKQEK